MLCCLTRHGATRLDMTVPGITSILSIALVYARWNKQQSRAQFLVKPSSSALHVGKNPKSTLHGIALCASARQMAIIQTEPSV